VKRINYCVAETHEKNDFALEISAPFSVAAQAEKGLAFYKRLPQEKVAVQKELEQITTDLIIQINALLPQIISIADPYANPVTLSETHIREFSLPYLFQLLKGLKTTSGGVVHLCPYCTSLLEKYGFVHIEIVAISQKPYRLALSEYAQTEQLVFIGHQCIHTSTVNKIFLLHISDGVL
jgi:uroporphyrinogen-III decarboxylase